MELLITILTPFILVAIVLSPMIYHSYKDTKSKDKNGNHKCSKCGKVPKVIYYHEKVFYTDWQCNECTDWDNL